MWWLIAWAYDYFVSRMEPEQRQEFDESLDDIRYADQRKDEAKRERLQQIKDMQARLESE